LAGYNFYSDQDGKLNGATVAPATAEGGVTYSLTDGVVHSVTAKPVGVSNGEFSAVVSDAVSVDLTASSILFQDDFTGTVLDTGKWTVTNNVPTKMDLVQNDQLEFNIIDVNGPGNSYEAHVVSLDSFNISTTKVMKFDVTSNRQDIAGGITIGLHASNDPVSSVGARFEIAASSATEMNARWHNGTAFDNFTFAIDVSTIKSFKVVLDTDCSWYYWNGSSWTLIRTVSAHGETGSFYALIGSREYGNDVVSDYLYVDDVYVTDADFATQNP
jgi:hypothetical protein